MRENTKMVRGANGKVRIISGIYKGRRLDVINLPGLRPSTDRVRETLFNWLMGHTQGHRVLDLFAGSGILSFEAMSRGASDATLIEQDKKALNQILRNIRTLELANTRVLHGDALKLLPTLKGQYSLVFIDPPFRQALVVAALNSLITNQLLCDRAFVYIEHEAELSIPLPAALRVHKTLQTSSMSVSLCMFDQANTKITDS